MSIESTHENGQQIRQIPLGHAQVTVSTSVVGLPSIPDRKRVRKVVVRPVDQPINYRDDGQDPTTTTGMHLFAGDAFVYDGDPDLWRMCTDAAATGSADVRVAYYGL